jgi:hypothetical protein
LNRIHWRMNTFISPHTFYFVVKYPSKMNILYLILIIMIWSIINYRIVIVFIVFSCFIKFWVGNPNNSHNSDEWLKSPLCENIPSSKTKTNTELPLFTDAADDTRGLLLLIFYLLEFAVWRWWLSMFVNGLAITTNSTF